ncbi:MAG: hypothetical protein JWP53_1638 [Conexibacter sp.]|nr:hypothetical protein [Conexibacter sp.]
MTAERFPVTDRTVELAQQLRRGLPAEDLDATAEEIVAAYKLLTAALIREGRFAVDIAHIGLELAEAAA